MGDYFNNNDYNDSGYNDNRYYNPYQRDTEKKKEKKENGFSKKLLRAVALGLAFGLVAGVFFEGGSYLTGKLIGTRTESVDEASNDEEGGSSDITSQGELESTAVSNAVAVEDVSDIAANFMPSIVAVTTISVTEYRSFFGRYGTQEVEGAGSGVIVSDDDDYVYIATNNHVVSGARSLTITFSDDSAVSAEILGTDANTDLAVVRVKKTDIADSTMDNIKVATLGDSSSVKVGSGSVVIGNALGYGQSVTTGVISALDREVELEGENGETITNRLIQTDAAVNPGNSGGALLNMKGEVIGIVSAKYSDTKVEGMGYAIPITQAKEIITLLMSGKAASTEDDSISSYENENTAYLGISGVDVTDAYAIKYSMPAGVYIAGVYTGSGAHIAGLSRGDVITAIDGVMISSMDGIKAYLSDKNPGDVVRVTISTADSGYLETKTIDVTLSSKDIIE